MNEVFCIFLCDSDGYTYSSETLTGIFLTQEDAETALLVHTEHMAKLQRRMEEVNEEWRSMMQAVHDMKPGAGERLNAYKEAWEKEKAASGWDYCIDDLDQYVIRPITVGAIFPC